MRIIRHKQRLSTLYFSALKAAVENGEVSTAIVQRHTHCPWPKANEICDWIANNNFSEPRLLGGKPSKITLTKREFNKRFKEDKHVVM